ncbi:MAG: methyltransferase domain-containing protein [Thermoanaerobaculia bacterium]|jgi:ubiquinone/menaquinone biosynthesis C-methylase UbiE|nr:methyltransferase domain-containing protein [Thermoanaerobaculia bacterium]
MTTLHQRRAADFFNGPAEAYDEILFAATRGADRRWKEALLAHLDAPARVLDLACGTGTLTFMIRDRFPEAEVVGVDDSVARLDHALKRAHLRRDHRTRFVLGSFERLVPAGRFDVVTSCYLPKHADLPRLVSRLSSFLNPGGLVVMHDLTYPEHPVVRKAWERHFRRLRHTALTEWPAALRVFDELPEIVRRSAWVEELTMLFVAHGYSGIAVERLGRGTSALVLARLPCE